MIPGKLANRIASLALLDKGLVDGFTKPFRESDVEKSNLAFSVLDVTETEIRFRISGNTSGKRQVGQAFVRNMPRHEDIPKYRGVTTEILGEATLDRMAQQFTKFRMIASGTRVGGAYVGRTPSDWTEHPIGIFV